MGRWRGGSVGRRRIGCRSMGRRLEGLKVLADVNDAVVKRRFEDGQGASINPSMQKNRLSRY